MIYGGICYFPLDCNFFQPLLGQVLGASWALWAGARKGGMQLWPPRDLWVGSSPRAGLPNQSLLTVASS